jgi:hypothetical protein
MEEMPEKNIARRPEIIANECQRVYTGHVMICIPENTMKSISGFILANALKESWENSQTLIIEDYSGGCE